MSVERAWLGGYCGVTGRFPVTRNGVCHDRSLKHPRGGGGGEGGGGGGWLIEDVLVKVDKFIFPADFIVLDMEEDKEMPIILGGHF